MALGIRPINEFTFKKTFGTPENRLALISLLNAIVQLEAPIVDVTIENPYNLQDFYDDKLSILDIKAIDQLGRIHNVEMQLTAEIGLVQRMVFYGCELYSGQMKLAENYEDLHSDHSTCLVPSLQQAKACTPTFPDDRARWCSTFRLLSSLRQVLPGKSPGDTAFLGLMMSESSAGKRSRHTKPNQQSPGFYRFLKRCPRARDPQAA